MPYSDWGDAARYPLHAAAFEGRLADLAARLTAKGARGTLAAGTPCAPRPTPLPSHPRRVCVAAALARRDETADNRGSMSWTVGWTALDWAAC